MRLQVELWTESPAPLPITSIPLPRASTREVPAGAILGEAQPLSPHPHSCSSKEGVGRAGWGGGVDEEKGKKSQAALLSPAKSEK